MLGASGRKSEADDVPVTEKTPTRSTSRLSTFCGFQTHPSSPESTSPASPAGSRASSSPTTSACSPSRPPISPAGSTRRRRRGSSSTAASRPTPSARPVTRLVSRRFSAFRRSGRNAVRSASKFASFFLAFSRRRTRESRESGFFSIFFSRPRSRRGRGRRAPRRVRHSCGRGGQRLSQGANGGPPSARKTFQTGGESDLILLPFFPPYNYHHNPSALKLFFPLLTLYEAGLLKPD